MSSYNRSGFERGGLRPAYTTTLLDDFEDISGWSMTNGTKAADTTNKVTGTQGLLITRTGGTSAQALKTVDIPFDGKYMRIWANVPDIGAVTYLQVLVWTGSAVGSDYYSWTFQSSNGRLVAGAQQFDCNVKLAYKNNNPNASNVIKKIRIDVGSSTTGAITVDRLEMVSRRPYFLFVNDGARQEFVNDVLPLVAARGLKCDVLYYSDEIENWIVDPADATFGGITLAEAKAGIAAGSIYPGVHTAPAQASDGAFQTFLDQSLVDRATLGLLPDGPIHICAFQNDWVNDARRDYAAGRPGVAVVRQGNGATAPTEWIDGIGMHYIQPAPATTFLALPVVELKETTTVEDVQGWFDNAIAYETAFVAFGHGTDRITPTSRAPLAVYEAFWAKYDAVKGSIDSLTTAELAERFRDWPLTRTRNSAYSY